jgi:hypothetical protein
MTKKTIALSLIALALPIGVFAQNALPSTVWTCTSLGSVVTCTTTMDNAKIAQDTAIAAAGALSKSALSADRVTFIGTIHGRAYGDVCPYGVCTTETTRTTNDAAGSSVSTTTTGRPGSTSSTK